MTREEMIEGLKAGKPLCLYHDIAHCFDLCLLFSLHREGLIDVNCRSTSVEKYMYIEPNWKKS